MWHNQQGRSTGQIIVAVWCALGTSILAQDVRDDANHLTASCQQLCREMAAELLSKLLTRPDMQQLRENTLAQFIDMLADSDDSATRCDSCHVSKLQRINIVPRDTCHDQACCVPEASMMSAAGADCAANDTFEVPPCFTVRAMSTRTVKLQPNPGCPSAPSLTTAK